MVLKPCITIVKLIYYFDLVYRWLLYNNSSVNTQCTSVCSSCKVRKKIHLKSVLFMRRKLFYSQIQKMHSSKIQENGILYVFHHRLQFKCDTWSVCMLLGLSTKKWNGTKLKFAYVCWIKKNPIFVKWNRTALYPLSISR